ncbi:ATP-grasp fold amidoligase family protein [Bacteroides sp.]|uniref:ATP-grasp fold amidoligase family protein n=1 Tax=Bacteroides sp. TaxID=29523 RepID=UPI00261AC8C8|nr:ATP-grasp fold amidoligase family protein [Bacteroides sp.]MDD3038176.1 ATP-grasp fold amidoligase family protein [Bacteroides sp.]
MKEKLILVLNSIYCVWGRISPKTLAKHIFRKSLGRKLDFKNPVDLNEKINYLKFYSDTSSWSRLADKYQVRTYIEEMGLKDLLVPLIGVYTTPRQIDFESLPNEFIIKPTHGSGDVVIVNDKSKIDINKLRKDLKKALKSRLGLLRAEPHYLKIKPKLVIEQLLKEDSQSVESCSLVDYKIWCFDGNPYSIEIYYNRTKHDVKCLAYDINWNNITDSYFDFKGKFTRGESFDKPLTLETMLHSAKILSQGFPEVRVDFYLVGGRVYFGEMTFTSSGGYDNTIIQSRLNKMGELINI